MEYWILPKSIYSTLLVRRIVIIVNSLLFFKTSAIASRGFFRQNFPKIFGTQTVNERVTLRRKESRETSPSVITRYVQSRRAVLGLQIALPQHSLLRYNLAKELTSLSVTLQDKAIWRCACASSQPVPLLIGLLSSLRTLKLFSYLTRPPICRPCKWLSIRNSFFNLLYKCMDRHLMVWLLSVSSNWKYQLLSAYRNHYRTFLRQQTLPFDGAFLQPSLYYRCSLRRHEQCVSASTIIKWSGSSMNIFSFKLPNKYIIVTSNCLMDIL